ATGGMAGPVCLWDAATGKLLRPFEGQQSWAGHLAFSEDGRTLISGGGDFSASLWEVATGKERARFAGHRAAVRAVALSRGRRLASGSEDTTILVWDVTGGAAASAARSRAQLDALWQDLGGADAAQAHRALWALVAAPREAVPFLQEKVRPAADTPRPTQERV